MAEIVLEQVDKYYGPGVKAVDKLSLRIKDGEFMVFVGPSGCGKTTALRMIAGLEEISNGTIAIGERVVNDVPPKDRDIAMVFQNYALYPHMTVEQNLAFALRLRRTPKQEKDRRVQQAARLLGLEPYLHRKPAALSGGQRQRVAMGRAIVREPAAYLMDEPLSNLDAKLRVGMRASLSQLHERLGTTTVYVTHDQIEAMTLGQRVAVLKDGVLQQVDTPQRLYNGPRNLFVAGFIGSPAMNMVLADLVRDDGPAVVFGGFRVPIGEDLVSARSGLDQYFGRQVVVGVRPGSFSDAGMEGVRSGPVMRVRCEVIEELGDEINVIFQMEAPPVTTADAKALAADAGGEDTGIAVDSDRTRWTATVDPSSGVRPGTAIDLVLDVRGIHFFDPDNGLAIGHVANRK